MGGQAVKVVRLLTKSFTPEVLSFPDSYQMPGVSLISKL